MLKFIYILLLVLLLVKHKYFLYYLVNSFIDYVKVVFFISFCKLYQYIILSCWCFIAYADFTPLYPDRSSCSAIRSKRMDFAHWPEFCRRLLLSYHYTVWLLWLRVHYFIYYSSCRYGRIIKSLWFNGSGIKNS